MLLYKIELGPFLYWFKKQSIRLEFDYLISQEWPSIVTFILEELVVKPDP